MWMKLRQMLPTCPVDSLTCHLPCEYLNLMCQKVFFFIISKWYNYSFTVTIHQKFKIYYKSIESPNPNILPKKKKERKKALILITTSSAVSAAHPSSRLTTSISSSLLHFSFYTANKYKECLQFYILSIKISVLDLITYDIIRIILNS